MLPQRNYKHLAIVFGNFHWTCFLYSVGYYVGPGFCWHLILSKCARGVYSIKVASVFVVRICNQVSEGEMLVSFSCGRMANIMRFYSESAIAILVDATLFDMEQKWSVIKANLSRASPLAEHNALVRDPQENSGNHLYFARCAGDAANTTAEYKKSVVRLYQTLENFLALTMSRRPPYTGCIEKLILDSHQRGRQYA